MSGNSTRPVYIYVYTPADNMRDPQNKLPPRFYLLRKIEIVNDRFMIYSCELYHRMMIPCRHILFSMQEYEPSMFGFWWLSIYQYVFERRDYEDMT